MASIIKSDNGVSSGITGIVQSADSSGQLVLQTTTSGGTATTAVTIDNTQKVTFANSIGFGSNAGITFNNSSALTNSTLNDYEVGTWTPTDVSGAGLSFSSNTGYYTKIGNLVYARLSVTYPSTASGLQAVISMPFTAASGNNGGGFISYTNLGLSTIYASYVNNGSAGLYPTTNAGTTVANATLSGKRLDYSVIYAANF